MPSYSYERLSAQDASFLMAERPSVHMHVAATQIYRTGRLRTDAGGVDFPSIKRATESVLHLIPRYRQRLKWIPFENHPVWVDDRQFNLDYHFRHTALPRPGQDEQLKHLSARIMSQPLDRSRPLWEMWVIEGLDDDRFAIISKIHHCMIDGMAGADLAQILLSPTPDYELGSVATYYPRPSPSAMELFVDSWRRRLSIPARVVEGIQQLRHTPGIWDEVEARGRAIGELVGWAVRPASETPINGRLGPHRRFDWLQMRLDDVKKTSKGLGCSVNDVVLAIVAGAVREFLIRRRVRPEEIDFRASAPVSVRREAERGQMGNRVSSWILQLPVGEADPVARLQAIHRATEELKRSKQALGVETIMKMAEFTPAVLMSLGARAASGPINTIVTNVPGPQLPLYLLGAELEAMYPMVPLLDNTGLGIALFSYDGRLCWGFNADYELMPDLRSLVLSVRSSFEALAQAAGVTPEAVDRGSDAPPVIDFRRGRRDASESAPRTPVRARSDAES